MLLPETVIERKGYYYGSPSLEEGLTVAFLLLTIREGFRKQKWKFKMAFAMKGKGSDALWQMPF